MDKFAKVLFALWLVALPLATACRARAWRSDQALWSAAADVPPVSRRTWGNLRRWEMILLLDEQRALAPERQPFSGRERPR